jgi:hypothetical protein
VDPPANSSNEVNLPIPTLPKKVSPALTLPLVSRKELLVAFERPEVSLFAPEPNEKISIIYIADATDDENPSSTDKLKKIWNYARTTTPAGILADLRNAKDELIESKVSLD